MICHCCVYSFCAASEINAATFNSFASQLSVHVLDGGKETIEGQERKMCDVAEDREAVDSWCFLFSKGRIMCLFTLDGRTCHIEPMHSGL